MLQKEPEKVFNELTFCVNHCTLAHMFGVVWSGLLCIWRLLDSESAESLILWALADFVEEAAKAGKF